VKNDPLKGWNLEKPKKTSIYSLENVGKTFVSFDLKKGNFNAIKQFCPTLFSGTWNDFISQFTESQFALDTKNRRNYIFVNAGLHDLCVRICEYEIDQLDQYLKQQELNLGVPVFKHNDEIIFEISKNQSNDIQLVMKDYPKNQLFRMEFITLEEIPGTQSFLKVTLDGEKRKIKNVRPRHLMKTIDMVNRMNGKKKNSGKKSKQKNNGNRKGKKGKSKKSRK
jgi:hypothetical protein